MGRGWQKLGGGGRGHPLRTMRHPTGAYTFYKKLSFLNFLHPIVMLFLSFLHKNIFFSKILKYNPRKPTGPRKNSAYYGDFPCIWKVLHCKDAPCHGNAPCNGNCPYHNDFPRICEVLRCNDSPYYCDVANHGEFPCVCEVLRCNDAPYHGKFLWV